MDIKKEVKYYLVLTGLSLIARILMLVAFVFALAYFVFLAIVFVIPLVIVVPLIVASITQKITKGIKKQWFTTLMSYLFVLVLATFLQEWFIDFLGRIIVFFHL